MMHDESLRASKEVSGRLFGGAGKVGSSILSPAERRFQPWLAGRIPHFIQTQHLTWMTVLWSALAVTWGYLSAHNREFIWLSILNVILQYGTDLSDGEVGRQRGTGLIRWGYYMDHFLDYVFLCSLFIGYAFLAPRGSTVLLFATALLWTGFLVHSFLAFGATNSFRIAYFGIGPSELRVLVILVNLLNLWFGVNSVARFLPLALVVSAFFIGSAVWSTQREIRALDRSEVQCRVDGC